VAGFTLGLYGKHVDSLLSDNNLIGSTPIGYQYDIRRVSHLADNRVHTIKSADFLVRRNHKTDLFINKALIQDIFHDLDYQGNTSLHIASTSSIESALFFIRRKLSLLGWCNNINMTVENDVCMSSFEILYQQRRFVIENNLFQECMIVVRKVLSNRVDTCM